MRVIKNITISLGVLALIAAAPACGDSGETTDNNDNTTADAGAEPSGDEPADDAAGSDDPGADDSDAAGSTEVAGSAAGSGSGG